MHPSLSTALFREVRPEFFRVLAGAKTGRLYVDALDALERAAELRVQGMERDDALALIEEAVEAHADVPLDESNPDSAALGTRENGRDCPKLREPRYSPRAARRDVPRSSHASDRERMARSSRPARFRVVIWR
jgi:hypothetical protein